MNSKTSEAVTPPIELGDVLLDDSQSISDERKLDRNEQELVKKLEEQVLKIDQQNEIDTFQNPRGDKTEKFKYAAQTAQNNKESGCQEGGR